jgi:acyl dehydratase
VADPAYSADPAEVPSDQLLAPPTFAACFTVGRSAELLADEELGAHPAVVHGGQEYEFHRPIRVGDVLACTPLIADISHRGSNEYLVLEVDCADASSGEPVVTSRGTIVFLGSAPAEQG